MQIPKTAFRLTAWILGVISGLVLLGYVSLSLLIGWGVRSWSNKAISQFGGDRVGALIAVVDCDTCKLSDRNHAVWALGQLCDKRALPVLRKYYTGKPCNHMSQICQHELSKAIKWTEGNSFMLPQLWRPFI